VNCRGTEALLPAYLDGELDLAHSLEVEEHLRECQVCAAALQPLRKAKEVVAEYAPYYTAPADLRRLVTKQAAAQLAPPPPSWRSSRSLLLMAASLCVAALVWRSVPYAGRSSADAIATEVTAGHVRSLLASHLMDVPSSDHHTVKPWFTGKLDFAPDVPDLAAKGFTLAGGRLDYLNGRTVAALVYRRRNHVVNLFTWPAETPGAAPRSITKDGFHLVHWSRAGMEWWAVSDLNAAELMEVAVPQ